MRSLAIASAMIVALSGAAYAVEKPSGSADAPSGAPKDAAEHGSSEAGKDAAVNEMKGQEATREENSKMSDPNKGNK